MSTVEESSSSSSSSSAEIIGSSHDLLLEILLRLPVKSLLKFKCVSKHWQSLITHPQFPRRKCHNPTRPPSALFLQYPYLFDDFAFGLSIVHLNRSNSHETTPLTILSFSDLSHGIEIMHSCNGLFCCSSVQLDGSPKHYYVYNPTTKQFATLPSLLHCVSGVPGILCGLNLAFDPSRSHSYKVICVQLTQSDNLFSHNYQIQIYSSESRSWRLSEALKPLGVSRVVDVPGGVYWNGSIHWVSANNVLVYFDVEEAEVIRDMPFPPDSPSYYDGPIYRQLLEWQGHLHLVETYRASFDLEILVYEMERDRSGWIVKFSVDYTWVDSAFPDPLPYFSEGGSLFVLCVVREEKEEESFAVLLVQGAIIGYNFKSKSLWKICNVDGRPERFRNCASFQHIESLSPVQ